MTARLIAPLACVVLLSATPASADRFYPLDPASWATYSVERLTTTVVGPDGSAVHPFLSSEAHGSVGPAGYYEQPPYQTNLPVPTGVLAVLSSSYRWISGPHGAHLCIDGNITGYPVHQCLDLDGQTGTFDSVSPAIVWHSIAPDARRPGWFRVSIMFRTSAMFGNGNQAFPYWQFADLETAAICCVELITGKTP